MREEELIAHAKRLIAEKGIVSRMGLAKADSGLYYALRGRELLDEAGLEEGIRYWAGMGRDELVAHAKRFIAERGIIGRSELEKADSGLYRALRKRKLLGEIGLEEKLRYWAGMENDELVAHAKRFIAERGIIGRRELEKADSGLYQALRKRKLLGEIGLKKKSRDWAMMKRDELVAHANRFIAEKGIAGRGELKEADSGLYFVLSKRKLLDEMGLQDSNSEHRDWAGMGREELVAHAKEFIEKKCVRGRAELERADKGLYLVLLKMRLLDAVFSGIESEKRKEAVMGVIDTLESFGDGE